MHLATFDPTFPVSFADLKHFRIAFFDMMDNIVSGEDLDVKFCMIEEVDSYHPLGAIRQAYRKRAQPLMGSILPGDYFIISCPELEMMWRYTVFTGRPVGFTSSTTEPFDVMADPFGEVLRTWRGEYFTHGYKFKMIEEKPDGDISTYFTDRRELVVAR